MGPKTYRVSIVGDKPADLADRISSIHAATIDETVGENSLTAELVLTSTRRQLSRASPSTDSSVSNNVEYHEGVPK